MSWINLLIENGGLTAIFILLAVLYLERRITSVSDKLRDKMDSDHRELKHSIAEVRDSVAEVKDSLSEVKERVARLEGVIHLPSPDPVAPAQ